jgi:hypothetical protein
MTHKEVKAERDRNDLADFISERVIAGTYFDCVDIGHLRAEIGGRADEEPASVLCEYLELGNWFYEEMIECDFNVERFMDELESAFHAKDEEAARDQAEREDDYLCMVGAK